MAHDVFKKVGIKYTHQRQCVYAYLVAQNAPVTAEDIYLKLKDVPINLSTVYRVLEVFHKNNLIVKTQLGSEAKATYEVKRKEHRHHLVCIKCNAVTPISGCPLKTYEEKLKAETAYEIVDHKLEISGICPKCQSIKV